MTPQQLAALGAIVGASLCWNPVASAASPARLLDFSAGELRAIQQHGPWPPVAAPADPGNRWSGNPQAIALGQTLFFDKRLSVDGRMACASCHAPDQAFGDGLPRSMGRSANSPMKAQALERNAPTLWNAGYERWHGWDGAADSAWSQAIRPLTDAREMAASADHVARAIASDAALSCRWQKVFGQSPERDPQATLVNTAKALGAFAASLVSGSTPFDDFRSALDRGDTRRAARYGLSAQRGLRLFIGRGQCNVCHLGPMFSNGEFGDIGRPFFVRPGVVDPGRHGGILALQASHYNLLSPWADNVSDATATKTRHVDVQHRNFGEFKVPSLRNVALTAPYMHDGQLPSLNAVVQHYSQLNIERLHADGEQILKPLLLNAQESADLVAFLQSLSDPRARQWNHRRPPVLPRPAPSGCNAGPAS